MLNSRDHAQTDGQTVLQRLPPFLRTPPPPFILRPLPPFIRAAALSMPRLSFFMRPSSGGPLPLRPVPQQSQQQQERRGWRGQQSLNQD